MLRPAADADRDPVLAWRNHPEVRQASFTTHEIGAADHAAWWAGGGRDRILIFEYAGRPAGVVTIEADGTWGYYLDVAGLTERREFLPAWLELEREAIGYAFDVLGLERLTGETLAWNTPVLALHRRFGFRETDRHQRPVDGVPQEVVRTELRAADRLTVRR
ncbi:GNAT family N-acetyltransferase [Spirilliplanes yamanashiensis]|uniref:N-acetyltransferase domain-containing protein n=1 Tax=Spirilliplanes yamanashiensis TaxID=42233 RepID=A0A8J3Y5Q9_9ACTN|nr:GNAT family N-acetyltransferase [Spirilliplanes yamanashiensis]MDP9819193.1 RimJ/RimL family protein N-acetyltransferase [Spirilliplanes yamanashiensis]GIJ01984.1 hypothetical protein Sya03_13360 [Spirilliplanes yamanashiensis]